MVFQKFTHKGVFRPKNPDKYVGNSKNIIYRSSWEKRFMIYCDNTPEVISWASEELSIPYISPLDGRVHKYYPDFIIYYKTPEKLKTSVIEVKPQKETKPPRKKKNKKLFGKKTSDTELYYHQIFFHYVLQDGRRAHCAWDRAR